MNERNFTGERLHAGSDLFSVDLARHRAAYEFARSRAAGSRLLELGSGSGYGTATLAEVCAQAIGVDRVAPDAAHQRGSAKFLRADLNALPLAPQRFDLIVSFQVIEHLEDPAPYLGALAALLRPSGQAILTTPNVLMSDGVNPYHVHEYRAGELGDRLREFFQNVELHGIGTSAPVKRYLEARSRRIQRIVRLDPLRLRERLPSSWVESLFARFAILVRRRTQHGEGTPDASWRDFPIGAPDDDCLDLLALCARPRARA